MAIKEFSKDSIDFSRISSTREGAKNGEFFDVNSVHTEYWGDTEELSYEEIDGAILIKEGDVAMGWTDKEGIKNIETPANKIIGLSETSKESRESLESDKKTLVSIPFDEESREGNANNSISQSMEVPEMSLEELQQERMELKAYPNSENYELRKQKCIEGLAYYGLEW